MGFATCATPWASARQASMRPSVARRRSISKRSNITSGPRAPGLGQTAQGATARARIENLLIAGAESLPKSRATPANCTAVLAAVGDGWPAAIACVVKKVRLEMLGMLYSRLETAVAKGELPASTDVDGLSRFYLGVFQGMAIQARDGATQAELRGVAATAMAAWPGDGLHTAVGPAR